MSLLGSGKPAKAKKAAGKSSWSADKAAQQVLDRRAARRRTDDIGQANELAAAYWRARIVAIDPGDAYCGVAFFTDGVCRRALECAPQEMLRMVHTIVTSGNVDVLVVEQWQLYADKKDEQVGSEMLTAQAIGAIRWIVSSHNELIRGFAQANAGEAVSDQIGEVELVLQPAFIKVPATTAARHHGYAPVSAKTSGDHQRDAEIHGLFFIMRGKGEIRQ